MHKNVTLSFLYRTFYGIIVLLVILATLKDFLAKNKSDTNDENENNDKAECDQKGEEEEDNDLKEKVEQVNKTCEGMSMFHVYSLITHYIYCSGLKSDPELKPC